MAVSRARVDFLFKLAVPIVFLTSALAPPPPRPAAESKKTVDMSHNYRQGMSVCLPAQSGGNDPLRDKHAAPRPDHQ